MEGIRYERSPRQAFAISRNYRALKNERNEMVLVERKRGKVTNRRVLANLCVKKFEPA